ncbi:MAG: hypothetical protein ACI97B_001901 [Verrucomicrobiales bacterium]|jgi:hypothetical protein
MTRLTKSLFKRACDCPTQVYYATHPEYLDASGDDAFVESLAGGGFQVGALAQCYYPGGILVEADGLSDATTRTTELLAQDSAIIYEGAFQHGNLYVKADIVVKTGDRLDLIEVKAKSYDAGDDGPMFKKRGAGLDAKWEPYVMDVAFQKHVIQQCLPGLDVRAHLMLTDKRTQTSIDGLHQKFRIHRENGRQWVTTSGDVSPAALGDQILVCVNVDRAVDAIFEAPATEDWLALTFAEYVELLAEACSENRKIDMSVGTQCKGCPFHANAEEEAEGYLDGFKQCWKAQWKLTDEDFAQPNIFSLWNFRKTQDLLDARIYRLADVDPTSIQAKARNAGPGLNTTERQRLQVEKVKADDPSETIDRHGLSEVFASFTYPLHFIDFETNTAAIPFTKGRRPYETLAFQYSHHIVYEDGRIEHQGQYLNSEPGTFPNFDFLRALKTELETDGGTIFRYSNHENTVLNQIFTQLQEDPSELPDREELYAFIRSITKSSSKQAEKWAGERNMVDLCELVIKYYYNPHTQGSNSIKKVLPAVLNSSPMLQAKYAQAIYGSPTGIPSLNFTDKTWIAFEGSEVLDPYALLEPLAIGLNADELRYLDADEKLADGGAAMIAYNRLQFEDLPPEERRALEQSLLRYCELDTFAMVLIWEHWTQLLGDVV